MTIQELQVIISANTDQFKNELTSIGGKLDDFSKKAEKTGENTKNGLFGNLVGANVVGDIITKSIGNVIDSFKSLTNEVYSNGSAYSILKITTNTVAHNMNISASAIQGLRGQFNSLNIDAMQSEEIIKTLALSGLTNLSQKITTVDASTGQLVHGTNALIVAMNDLSTSAGITAGEGMDRITKFIRLGRVQAIDGMVDIGKLTIAENNFAASLHKTTEQLTQQQLEQFRVNVIMQESQKVIGDYANTSQTSARATELLGTALSNMATTLGSFLEPIFSVVQNALLTFVNALGVELNGSAISIQDWATSVAGYIMGLVRIIGSLLSWLPIVGAGFQALANFSLKPVRNIDATANSVQNLTNQTNALNHAMAGLASFDQMNVLTPQAGAGAGAVPASPSTAIGGMGSTLDVGKINDTADSLVSKFKDLQFSISKAFDLGSIGKGIGSFLSDSLGQFDSFLNSVTGFGIKDLLLFEFVSPFALLPKVLSNLGLFDYFKQGKVSVINDVKEMSNRSQFEVISMTEGMIDHLISWEATSNKISKENANNMIKDVEKIKNDTIQASNKKNDKVIKDLQYLRDVSKTITSDQYDDMLQKANNTKDKQINVTKDMAIQVENQLKSLSDTGVVITDEMRKSITSKIVSLRDNSVAVMSDNQVQQKAILEKLKTENGQITAEQASYSISESMKVRDSKIFDANKTYDDTVASIIRLRDDSGTITAEQATAMIKKANDTKDDQIKASKDAHDGVVKEVTAMAGDNINQVDLMTGKTKSGFELMLSNISSGFNKFGTDVQNNWNDLWGTKIPKAISDLKQKMKDIWNAIGTDLKSIWNGITNTIKDAINHLLHLINDGLGGINSFANKLSDTLAQIPGSQKINLQIGTIPYLASGGIVDAPTVAMIGEGGYKEAVLPLDRNTGWAEKVATLINGAMGNTGEGGQTLVVQLGSEKIYEKFISYLNDKSLATNTAVINI